MIFEKDTDTRELVKEILVNQFKVKYLDEFSGRTDICDYHFIPSNVEEGTVEYKEHFLEVKHRNFNYDKYKLTFISYYKYQSLIDLSKYFPTHLIILFNDCFVWFNTEALKKAFVKYDFVDAPDGDKDYNMSIKHKKMAYLRLSDGKKYFYKNNLYKK